MTVSPLLTLVKMVVTLSAVQENNRGLLNETRGYLQPLETQLENVSPVFG